MINKPDLMLSDEIKEGLETEIIGRKIISYAQTSSTNDLALDLAASGNAGGHSHNCGESDQRERSQEAEMDITYRDKYSGFVDPPPVYYGTRSAYHNSDKCRRR